MLGSFGRRLRPTPSMVVASAALIVALGGTSYAVSRVPARSVGATQLKNGAVTRSKIAKNAIDTTKVALSALTGDDIKERTLRRVGSAANADRATTALGLDKVIYKTATGNVGPNGQSAATATCDAGQHAVSGGVKVDDIGNTGIVDSYPLPGGTAWTAHVFNLDTARGHGYSVTAVCVPVTTVG